jgi:Flp pilus assembly protein CpaB
MSAAIAPAIPRRLAIRQPNVRVIMGVALSLAGAAIVLWLHQTSQPHTVAVLRAAHDIPAGATLRADDLVPVSEPVSDAVAATLVPALERDALIGHPIGQPINRGELVTRGRVVAPVRRIPAGQRVLTIPVPPETAAGGQIQVGDEVQILVTLNKARPEQAQTFTVLDRATVYAIGTREASSTAFAVADQSSLGSGKLAWLAILADATQAQALAKARWTGDLDVALLPPLEEGP